MNERIKELADEAHRLLSIDAMNGGDFNMRTFEQKFAELIVKECASICELNGQSYKHSFTPMKAQLAESTSKYCGGLIKRTFGVEE